MNKKRAERRAQFQKLGAAISAIKKVGDPNAPDYFTGRESAFDMKRFDSFDRDSEDPLNKDASDRTQIAFGPAFKTPQWMRTLAE